MALLEGLGASWTGVHMPTWAAIAKPLCLFFPKTHWPGGNQGGKVLKILQSKQFKPLPPQTDGTRQQKGMTLTRLSCQTNGVIAPTQKLL